MDELIKKIKEYAYDTENIEKNYALAIIYDSMGQTASAILFFLRTAELVIEQSGDKLLAYECLLKCANCYNKQGNRRHTVTILIKHALCLLPKRPEAYYIYSKLMEVAHEYVESYTYAQMALGSCDFDGPSLRSDVGYPGIWGLIFEKAISAWHWGKGLESRRLLLDLKNNYCDVMDLEHKNVVQTNLTSLGAGPVDVAIRTYTKSLYNRLKTKFPGSENIERNFSQIYQDMFVLTCLDGKTNGTYLEIGAGAPFLGNNTALLEKFKWKGIGIEYNEKLVNEHINNRKNKVLCEDALKVNYEDLLKEISVNGVVDYLQLDCEPSKTTFEILLSIPFEKYKFAVITYEHDHYVDMTSSYRTKSRGYLKSMGYELVAGNMSPTDFCPFEDWWVHPDLVDRSIIDKIKSPDADVNFIEDFMLLPKKKNN